MDPVQKQNDAFQVIEAIAQEGSGFIKDLDIEIYHHPKCPGISNSSLSKVAGPDGTLADLLEYRTRGAEPKQWGEYGNAVHFALTQPDLFKDKYACLPEGLNFAVKAGKEFKADADARGLTTLRYEEYQGVLRSVENVKMHKYASDFIFGGEGIVEGSCFWRDDTTGMLCKTRPDRLLRDIVVEIKTTVDASPNAFKYSVEKYGYHRQGAFQIDGVRAALKSNPEYFVIVAIEKAPPYKVCCHVINARAIKKGREEYKTLLGQVKQAEATNTWPGYPDELNPLDLPERSYEEIV